MFGRGGRSNSRAKDFKDTRTPSSLHMDLKDPKYVKIPRQKVNLPSRLNHESTSNNVWWNLYPTSQTSKASQKLTDKGLNVSANNKTQNMNMHQLTATATTTAVASSKGLSVSGLNKDNKTDNNKLRIPLEEGKMVYNYYLERYESNQNSMNLSSDDKYINQILKKISGKKRN